MDYTTQHPFPDWLKTVLIVFAVLTMHIVVLHIIWNHMNRDLLREEKLKFLESFVMYASSQQSADPQTLESTADNHVVDTHAIEIKGVKTQTIVDIPAPSPRATPKPTNASRSGIALKGNIGQSTDLTPPVTHAHYLSNPPPVYPRQSRRSGEQGKVVIAVEITTDGLASQAMINTSSGYPRLDRAALETVLKWRFVAGKKAGIPQKMWAYIPINFVLK